MNLESNNVLQTSQPGFKKQHSCELALQYASAMWRKEINQDKFGFDLFVNLKHVFKTINLDIPLQSLRYCDVNGTPFKHSNGLSDDTLRNRTKQSVCIAFRKVVCWVHICL